MDSRVQGFYGPEMAFWGGGGVLCYSKAEGKIRSDFKKYFMLARSVWASYKLKFFTNTACKEKYVCKYEVVFFIFFIVLERDYTVYWWL
jgi:hypothetical protein